MLTLADRGLFQIDPVVIVHLNTLSGVAVETDDATGLAARVAAVRIGPTLDRTVPDFW